MLQAVPRLRLALAVATVVLAMLTANRGPQSAVAAFTDSDGDAAADLVERIVGSDPGDSQSLPEDSSYPLLLNRQTRCADGTDNDRDGLIDSADSGCLDLDGDLASDGAELLLGSDPHDGDSFPEDARFDSILVAAGFPLRLCADEGDDDGDGLIDEADPGCAPVDADGDTFQDFAEKALGSDWEDAGSRPEHITISPMTCSDGVDNDGDGLTDEADGGCMMAPNDDLADAINIDALPFTHTAKAAQATRETGEVVSGCRLAVEAGGTVWYRFTAPAATPVVVDTSGSDLVGTISVWRPGEFGLVEVDCSITFPFFSSGSRFAFAAHAGETYLVQVERFPSEDAGPALLDFGRLAFHLEAASPPANDDFAAAQAIDILPFAALADTVAAGVELSEPDVSCRGQGHPANSVWYRYAPSADGYILASVIESDFGLTLGAYRGTSQATLQQVACSRRGQLAFHARAGETYYLQAAGYRCQLPENDIVIASFCVDSRSGTFQLRVETFELPRCPPVTFSMPDPRGDADDDAYPVDIVSLSVGLGDQHVCISATLDPPLAPRDVRVWLEMDADLAGPPSYGGSHIFVACDYPTGLHLDHRVSVSRGDEGLLTSVSTLGSSGPRRSHLAYVTYDGYRATLILPIEGIGGDADFGFAIEMSHLDTYDCAPNGGSITCQAGVCALAPFRNGDANCNGPANVIDAALILQFGAGLLSALSCPHAADVNGDGSVDSRDAALVLQFTAGLLDRLPPLLPVGPGR
jgi:hypothetical protein